MDFGFSQHRERSNSMLESDRLSQRVAMTLDSLTAISRSVSGYPGRKNLVWLSGSFPIRLRSGIDFNRLNDSHGINTTGVVSNPNFTEEVRRTTTALSAARIAVYPIDVRGIQNSDVGISVSAAASQSFSGTANPGAYSDNLNSQSETRFQEHSSMKEVAEQTGGEVLTGNNVRDLIGRGISDSSIYYTLAYTPVRADSDPGFRKIEIKTNRDGVHTSYRPGYYPNSNLDNPTQKTHPLVVAMQPGMANSTVIPLTVQVTPPGVANKKTSIAYTIDVTGIDFAEASGQHAAAFDCIAVAFSKSGKPMGQASSGVEARLTPAEYEATLRTGLHVRQEIDLPSGQYDLRLGVMDKASQKIGTLLVPLTVTPTK
jgi:hypothetical protein